MTFFYRERPWYAGQFIRKIKCKYDIDKYSGIYLETILGGLSQYLLSGLVRDVDEAFLTASIYLPVDKDDNIDFEWMKHFVKEQKKKVLYEIIKKYDDELGLNGSDQIE